MRPYCAVRTTNTLSCVCRAGRWRSSVGIGAGLPFSCICSSSSKNKREELNPKIVGRPTFLVVLIIQPFPRRSSGARECNATERVLRWIERDVKIVYSVTNAADFDSAICSTGNRRKELSCKKVSEIHCSPHSNLHVMFLTLIPFFTFNFSIRLSRPIRCNRR